MINSSDNLLYNLSYLSSVIHPVIILRLLEHRIFTPLFKKKSVLTNPPLPTNPSNENLLTINTSLFIGISSVSKSDMQIQQRDSLTKPAGKTSRGTPNTSISGVTTTSLQLATNHDLSANPTNATDLSSLFHPTVANNPSLTTRKWFWRNSEKNIQPNISNDRNPLLQAIVEADPTASSGSIPSTTANVAGCRRD